MENFESIEERRRYRRVPSTLTLQYKDLRKPVQNPMGTMAKNLSEGGICFNSREFISLACRLVVEINLPTNPKPIKAISKVAWIRKLSRGDEYELGNQFLEMSREDKTYVANFINEVLNTSL